MEKLSYGGIDVSKDRPDVVVLPEFLRQRIGQSRPNEELERVAF